MEIIENIPVSLEPEDVARRLRVDPARAGFAVVGEVAGIARPLIHLRAVCEISYIGVKDRETVKIGRVVFRSRVLRHNLDRAQKVFPFIITVGPELEKTAASVGDLLRQYYLEELANIVLEQGAGWLAEKLSRRWGFPGLSSMSPGSLEDWPITEQPKLFSLFGDTEKSVGVRLTDSLLMVPRKSISGIFFPSEEGFVSCRLCSRENCPSRKVDYDESRT
ncbi:MAG: vitamin B12 dependent-methionine synthase activation domain-containing protein [Candidatus Aminicenantales bacterium]